MLKFIYNSAKDVEFNNVQHVEFPICFFANMIINSLNLMDFLRLQCSSQLGRNMYINDFIKGYT